MTTYRKRHEYWTETHRVVTDVQGEQQVKVVSCCCGAPAATRKQCAIASGNKTPCRCFCHSNRLPTPAEIDNAVADDGIT